SEVPLESDHKKEPEASTVAVPSDNLPDLPEVKGIDDPSGSFLYTSLGRRIVPSIPSLFVDIRTKNELKWTDNFGVDLKSTFREALATCEQAETPVMLGQGTSSSIKLVPLKYLRNKIQGKYAGTHSH